MTESHTPYTEKNIQGLLMQHILGRLQHQMAVPNCRLFPAWEADVLSLNKGDALVEWEIKVSRADFLADKAKTLKHDRLMLPGFYKRSVPAYFYYVMPASLKVGADEIPEYAGCAWVYTAPWGPYMAIEKRAPRLHDGKADQRQYKALIRSLNWKTANIWRKVHPLEVENESGSD